jgi:hypothetical protein
MHALAFAPAPRPEANERELRGQIDRSVSRALFDAEFAQLLLSDPARAVNGCTPRQHRQLRKIRAHDLVDFARQAQALFWLSPSAGYDYQDEEEALQPTAMGS